MLIFKRILENLMLNLFFESALLVFVYMSILFGVAILRKDNSIADIGWGIGFIFIAIFTLFKTNLFLERHLLITFMTLLWGLRLSGHIFMRNKGKGEDPRYARWRAEWGSHFLIRSYLQVFMLQGCMMLLIATPIIAVNNSATQGLTIVDFIGFFIWLIGLLCEATADYQLAAFLKKPESKGHIMMQGIWQYSRHPNYFGEVLIWWGMFIVALTVSGGFYTIISPLTITILLLFISGIPLAEKQIEHLPEFTEYKKKTSIFFPWFIKKG